MATKIALVIFLNLFLIFFHFSSLATSGADNPINSAISEMVKKSVQKQLNKTYESANSQDKEAPQSSGIYEITFGVGTPPQNVTSVIDISNGFTWTQCTTCTRCFNQTTPLYDPELSSTYANFSSLRCNSTDSKKFSYCDRIYPSSCPRTCNYLATYNMDVVQGIYATDNFTFGSTSAPDIFFGCAVQNFGDHLGNASGSLGLGWGPQSVVSQFPFMRFSYCLSSDQRKHSPVNFGSLAKLQGSGQSTPLLRSDLYPDAYYVGLVNITVGTTVLDIPSSTFQLTKSGFGGVFLATLIAFTYLEQTAYDVVEQAFISSMNNQTTIDGTDLGLNLCYKNVTKWPSLTLHFDGGATLKLKTINYVYKDTDTGIQCLSILPSIKSQSALGTYIQMDTNFVYDLNNKTISFETCFVELETSAVILSNIPHLVTTMALFLFYMLEFF